MNTDTPTNIPIGHKFQRYNVKHSRIETVIDILKTYSEITGELVKTRYVTQHEFMGQSVKDYDVNIVTIQRSKTIKTEQAA